MNTLSIPRGGAAEFPRDLLPGGAPAAFGQPAEVAKITSASSLGAVRAIEWSRDMSPAEKREAINAHNAEMQDIAEEQTLLYQATKKYYSRPATEGGR